MTTNSDATTNGISTRIPSWRKNGYEAIPDVITDKQVSPSRHVWVLHDHYARECVAEFFGTFVLLSLGLGACHQVSITNQTFGTYVSINMAWGIGCMLGTHCAGAISGADFNPAVSFARAVYGQLPWWKVPGYVAAQMLGAFVASFGIFLMHRDSINVIDPGRTFAYKNFVTFPYPHVTLPTAVYTEFFATMMLCIGINALTDRKNRGVKVTEAPLRMMLLMWSIGMALGMNTGFAMNPARDFAPRLFTCLAGWGWQVFEMDNYYFWVPIVAPMFGSVAGYGIYKLMIENHFPSESSVADKESALQEATA